MLVSYVCILQGDDASVPFLLMCSSCVDAVSTNISHENKNGQVTSHLHHAL